MIYKIKLKSNYSDFQTGKCGRAEKARKSKQHYTPHTAQDKNKTMN